VPGFDPEAFARDSELGQEGSVSTAEHRAALEHECLSAVGSGSAVLVAAVTGEQLKGFPLDNVSAFLFSRLDGVINVETLLDISGLPRLLALQRLRGLVEQGVVVRR
jgi:hypothetical protein